MSNIFHRTSAKTEAKEPSKKTSKSSWLQQEGLKRRPVAPSNPPAQPADRDAVQAVWRLLMNGADRGTLETAGVAPDLIDKVLGQGLTRSGALRRAPSPNSEIKTRVKLSMQPAHQNMSSSIPGNVELPTGVEPSYRQLAAADLNKPLPPLPGGAISPEHQVRRKPVGSPRSKSFELSADSRSSQASSSPLSLQRSELFEVDPRFDGAKSRSLEASPFSSMASVPEPLYDLEPAPLNIVKKKPLTTG